MLIFDYIKFVQLSIKECVNYKQCLNSLRTALVCMIKWQNIILSSIDFRERQVIHSLML